MNKIIVNSILAICTLGLAWACYWSIYSDIDFDSQKKEREDKVKVRLTQIKEAEELYKKTYGQYVGTLDSLIDFLNNEMCVANIIKEGELTDDQLEEGLTEKEAVRKGIIRRDTIKEPALATLNKKLAGDGIPEIKEAKDLKIVPVGRPADGTFVVYKGADANDSTILDTVYNGQIEMRKKSTFNMRTNEFDILLEVRARLDDYMDGFSEKRIKNLKSDLKKLNKNRAELMLDNEDDTEGEWYGLRIGDLQDTSNKLAGNWDE